MAPQAKEKLSMEEFLRRSRVGRENNHRNIMRYKFIRTPLTISPALPFAFVTLDHLQDLCNKTTAIYWTRPGEVNSTYLEKLIYKK